MRNLFNKQNLYKLGVVTAISLASLGAGYNVGYNSGESRATQELNEAVQRVSYGLKNSYQKTSKELDSRLENPFDRKGMSPETVKGIKDLKINLAGRVIGAENFRENISQ